jgi:thiol:disulfide interchange protein DsbA
MSIRVGIVILAFLVLSTTVRASAVAGHDYMMLDVPRPQEVPGKIEVIEFFSWGCPHCYTFYPLVGRWVATLPKDVTFRRVPVGLGHPEWDNLARMYLALQTTGDLVRLDSPIFEAIHKDHVTLFDEKSITEWVGKHGVKVAPFTAAFHSFGVDTSLGQSEQTLIDYRVDSIPTMAIGGRYTVSGDQSKMLGIVDELIVKARDLDKKPKK